MDFACVTFLLSVPSLQLRPLWMKMSKGSRMTERQNALAARLRKAGLF